MAESGHCQRKRQFTPNVPIAKVGCIRQSVLFDPETGSFFLDGAQASHVVSFGYTHPMVVNVGFADGSAHAIQRNIQWRTWYALCGLVDGEIDLEY